MSHKELQVLCGFAVLIIESILIASQIVLDPPPPNENVKPRSYIYSVDKNNLGKWHRSRRAANGISSEESDRQQRNFSHNVSILLDGLFKHYNKTFRPGYGYGPTKVQTNLVILSMGPISELNSDYSMDVYFRQKWRDVRLRFNGSEKMQALALNNRMLEYIWKPDTYFWNGKEYYVHTITTANKLLRLFPTGDILYSMRLAFYPADIQSCPLIIGSFAFQAHDVLYEWDDQNVTTEKKELLLSQYELQGYPCESFFALFDIGMKKENYSMVRVDFQFQRRMGYFLFQIYLPCVLIVILSWVSFWLNREATERLSLGITALLTLATMNQDQKDILPKTSTPTALEWYILICNLYVSASIIQFAAVHFFTKTGFEEIRNVPRGSQDDEDEWEDVQDSQIAQTLQKFSNPKMYPHSGSSSSSRSNAKELVSVVPVDNHRTLAPYVVTNEERFANESACQKLIYCITGNERYRTELLRRGKYRESSNNSVSLLDRASRILFPLSFGVVNLVYWTSFLYAKAPKRTVVGEHSPATA